MVLGLCSVLRCKSGGGCSGIRARFLGSSSKYSSRGWCSDWGCTQGGMWPTVRMLPSLGVPKPSGTGGQDASSCLDPANGFKSLPRTHFHSHSLLHRLAPVSYMQMPAHARHRLRTSSPTSAVPTSPWHCPHSTRQRRPGELPMAPAPGRRAGGSQGWCRHPGDEHGVGWKRCARHSTGCMGSIAGLLVV